MLPETFKILAKSAPVSKKNMVIGGLTFEATNVLDRIDNLKSVLVEQTPFVNKIEILHILCSCRTISPTVYSYPHGQCRSVAVGGFLLGGGVNWMGTYNK
jgi:hypothetical protein